jgi:transposase-like protein
MDLPKKVESGISWNPSNLIHMGKQKYDEAFKRNAVSLVESDHTSAQVALGLGLHANQLYEWCRRYRNRPSDHGNASSNQSEVEWRSEFAITRLHKDRMPP